MPYEIYWYVPKRVICYKSLGVLTPDEIYIGNAEIVEYLEKATPPAYVIYDSTDLEKFPFDIQFMKINYPLNHKNVGWVLLVGGNTMSKFIATVVTKIHATSFKHFDTLDDALVFLQQRDDSLTTLNDA